MCPKNKKEFTKDMPSGINIMGMGGTGEDLGKPSANPQPKPSSKQLMKENAQGS